MNELRFRQGKPWDAIVTDGKTVGGGYSSEEKLTEAYGGRLVCESVDPEFKALLLAAPDLLAACEAARQVMTDDDWHSDRSYIAYDDAVDLVRAAIAKARGEQEGSDG